MVQTHGASHRLYYRATLLTPKALIEAYAFPSFQENYSQATVSLDHLSAAILQQFDQCGLEPRSAYFFFTKPYGETPNIHIDGSRYSDLGAINWVFGGKGSRMQWYEFLPGFDDKMYSRRPSGTPAILLPPESCQLVTEDALQSPTLVRVGVPHKVTNTSPEPRYCLTVRFKNAFTFEEIENRLANGFLPS